MLYFNDNSGNHIPYFLGSLLLFFIFIYILKCGIQKYSRIYKYSFYFKAGLDHQSKDLEDEYKTLIEVFTSNIAEVEDFFLKCWNGS